MSSFGGVFLTNNGTVLQTKAQSGKLLKFTRIALGDGEKGPTNPSDQSKLIHEVKTLELLKLKTLPEGQIVVGGVLNNKDLITGFYWREIGLFAEDPDTKTEILYSYGYAKNGNAEYIPAGGGADVIEKAIDVFTIIGNASNVSAQINQSNVYETPDGTMEKIEIHNNKTAGVHGATSAATANRLMTRDSAGRAKVAPPSADDDIAILSTIKNAITNLINGSPSGLDTLQKLSQALGNDPNFSTNITNLIETKETPDGAKAKADKAETNAKNASAPIAHVEAGGNAHAAVTTTSNGFMVASDKTKLDGVATGANNYVHPATHSPSIITQDENNRFVTDVDKTNWNGKETPTGAQSKASAAESNAINFAKGFGIGDISKDISGTDLNVLDLTGFYKGNNLTNSPKGNVSDYFFVINQMHSTTNKVQIAFHYGTGSPNIPTIYIRNFRGGTWYAWEAIETVSGSQSKANATQVAKLTQDNGYSIVIPDGTDIKTINMSGFYIGYNMANMPSSKYYRILINANSQTSRFLIAIDSANLAYFATMNAGVWSDWVQIETPDGAKAKADKAETNAKNASAPIAHVGAGGNAHATVTTTLNGFMISTDKAKLDGVATGANNYVHPATHPPSIIAQDANNRFVTDVDKTNWNGKETTTGAQTKVDASFKRYKVANNTDIKTLPAGRYYGSLLLNGPLDISDSSWLSVDVFEASEHSMKQFLAIRNLDNKRWISTIHTDGVLRNWEEIITDNTQNIGTGWKTPTLLNGYVKGNADEPLRYKKIGNMLHLQITAYGTANGTTNPIFNLPAEYRPEYDLFPPVSMIGNYNTARGFIGKNGNVSISTKSEVISGMTGVMFHIVVPLM
ncbi:phage tail-collar fiber domain-containing protein [Peribacillus aracenensis]|uniref:phage tail-collar fiber domain-containing protein n=1 Tax=Peribacillus aracenensis TaxID=2976708 RepID=UPI0021A2B383|nr:phage tail protein [Peribacillus sp. BBB004]